MRTISLPTGNAWNHQWYDPGDVKKRVCSSHASLRPQPVGPWNPWSAPELAV